MVKSIMVPVDLAHKQALSKAISIAQDLATRHGAKITLVSVTGSAATEAAHNPTEYTEKLAAYGAELGEAFGSAVYTLPLVDNDVVANLGHLLVSTASEIGADLIVMASHVPGFIDHIFSSNAGYVASHAACSVYVVR